jgi:uncharacterized membrane protein YhaH (DUF805 family)
MNTSFLAIIKRIAAEQGEGILADAARLKAIVKDYAQNEPQPLRLAFGRAVEEGAYNALKSAPDAAERASRKAAIVQSLRDNHGLDPALSAEALDILEAALAGAGTATPQYQQPYQQPQVAPQSPSASPPPQYQQSQYQQSAPPPQYQQPNQPYYQGQWQQSAGQYQQPYPQSPAAPPPQYQQAGQGTAQKNAWQYFTDAFKKYTVFDGRARRSEYWYFTLFNWIFYFACCIIDNATGMYFTESFGVLETIQMLAFLLPSFAAAVRRLHDIDRSGWWCLVPIYNIVLFCREGNTGINKYGSDPKQFGAP